MAPGELDDGVVSLPYGLLQVVEAGNHVPALPHLLLFRLDHSENKYVSCRSGVLRVLNIEADAQSAKFQKTENLGPYGLRNGLGHGNTFQQLSEKKLVHF